MKEHLLRCMSQLLDEAPLWRWIVGMTGIGGTTDGDSRSQKLGASWSPSDLAGKRMMTGSLHAGTYVARVDSATRGCCDTGFGNTDLRKGA